MMVNHDSPLRSLPTRLHPIHVLHLDGIRISVEMAEVAAERLLASLHKASDGSISAEVVRQIVPMAMLDAWVIVECIHRVRELLEHMPGLKQKDPVIQLFYRKTLEAKRMRNFVQHLKGEIGKVATRELPLWGVLSWRSADVDSTQIGHLLVPGTLYPGSKNHGPYFGEACKAPVSDLVLRTAVGATKVLELVKTMEPVISLFERSLRRQVGQAPSSGADMIILFSSTPLL